jgi:hypothetical protein
MVVLVHRMARSAGQRVGRPSSSPATRLLALLAVAPSHLWALTGRGSHQRFGVVVYFLAPALTWVLTWSPLDWPCARTSVSLWFVESPPALTRVFTCIAILPSGRVVI